MLVGMFWPSPTSMAEGAVGQHQPGWENVFLGLEEADEKERVHARTDPGCPSSGPGPGEHMFPIVKVPEFDQVSSDKMGMS